MITLNDQERELFAMWLEQESALAYSASQEMKKRGVIGVVMGNLEENEAHAARCIAKMLRGNYARSSK